MDVFSPYTAILSRPWLYTMRAVSSTLHVEVKHLIEGHVEKLLECQIVARQCIVAVVRY